MTTPFTDAEVDTLLGFVGYGTPRGSTWFLGMEEAGGGEANLRARLAFRPVEDCREAHSILGITKHHEGRRVIQPTWRGMCLVMLHLNNAPSDIASIREYQATRLGAKDGDSFLCELLPIPKPTLDTWGYEAVLPQFASQNDYRFKVLGRRMELLRSLISANAPRYIIAYGKAYWSYYEDLFVGTAFHAVDRYRIGRSRNTTIALTPHFTARSMNRQFGPLTSHLASDG